MGTQHHAPAEVAHGRVVERVQRLPAEDVADEVVPVAKRPPRTRVQQPEPPVPLPVVPHDAYLDGREAIERGRQ